MRQHLLLDLLEQIRIVAEELLGVLSALTDADLTVTEPGTGLLDDLIGDGQVDQVARGADALVEHDVELGITEGRGDLVLHHASPYPVDGCSATFQNQNVQTSEKDGLLESTLIFPIPYSGDSEKTPLDVRGDNRYWLTCLDSERLPNNRQTLASDSRRPSFEAYSRSSLGNTGLSPLGPDDGTSEL